jgi:uncharacterized membrane protein
MSTQVTPRPRSNSLGVRLNLWTLSLFRHWLPSLLIVIGLYVSLPFVAPTLMHLGLTGAGNVLYAVYSPMCHQLAFRSWFLFGQQAAYPRAAANVPALQPFDAFAANVDAGLGRSIDFSNWTDVSYYAREFVGDEQMGYKVAICERDVAIYGTLFLCGLIYGIPAVRRHLRPAPIWLYVLVGLLPIGIDGFSQLLSYPPFGFWALRESTPFFRTATGALFGLMNGWLAFPYLEASARDVVQELEGKVARLRQREARIRAQQAQ